MSCRKNGYWSEAEVQEALIRSHINSGRSRSASGSGGSGAGAGAGAANYYLCEDCGEYHLTSKGDQHSVLSDPAVKERISKEQREQEWMDHLRKR